MMMKEYELPTIPYGPIDALNRRAAAVGSPGYAIKTAHANYNGHHVTVWWNDYKGYYIADYTWAGRIVIARGDFASCFAAAVAYYNKGDLAACVWFTLKEGDEEALKLIASDNRIIEKGTASRDWYTWQHECAVQSVKDYCFPGAFALRFDWELMQAVDSEKEYTEALKAKYINAYY